MHTHTCTHVCTHTACCGQVSMSLNNNTYDYEPEERFAPLSMHHAHTYAHTHSHTVHKYTPFQVC